jgi:hypothetical protein
MTTITKNPNASLTTVFKAPGLANLPTGAFLTSSGGTPVLQCVNPGGNNPPPKQVSFGPTQGQTTSIQPRNGQITASASIGPPPLPSASQICPNPNWSVRLISIPSISAYQVAVVNCPRLFYCALQEMRSSQHV